jgi:hypothetical protein
MANAPDRAAAKFSNRELDAAPLVRTACWGIGAAAALFLAVLAGLSDSGAPRVAAAVTALSGKAEKIAPAPPPAIAPPQIPPQLVTETRRLNEQVRLLAADQDRLIQRVSVLERNLEDVTGSIRRRDAAAQAASPPAHATVPVVIASTTSPWPAPPEPPSEQTPAARTDPQPLETKPEPAPEVTAALSSDTPLPPVRPAAEEVLGAPPAVESPKPPPGWQALPSPTSEPKGIRPAYGVDLGGAVSVDRLRLLWNSLRTHEPRLLQGLRPVTHIRETKRGGRPDVRLIVGPFANLEQAARLCAAVLNAGRYCEPAVFRGQRLSAR